MEGTDTLFLYEKQNQAVQSNIQTINLLDKFLQKMNLLNLNTDTWVNLIANLGVFLIPFLIGISLIRLGYITLGALFGIIQLNNFFVNPILQMLTARNKLSTTQILKKDLRAICIIQKSKVLPSKEFSKTLNY